MRDFPAHEDSAVFLMRGEPRPRVGDGLVALTPAPLSLSRERPGERLHRELQCAATRRTPQWGTLQHPQGSPGSHRSLAAPLQRDPPTWQPGTPTPDTGTDRYASILNNELYRGRIIYGRRRFVRDPQTGKRRVRLTPESEWTVQEAPALRIVDETLWLRVQARRAAGHDRRRGAGPNRQGTPRPLSDLLHCGVCGGKMALINQSRYRCVERRNNIDNCTNGRGIAAAELETRAAQKLHDWVISQPNWAAKLGQAAQSLSQRRTAIQARIADTDQRIEALLDAIEAGGPGRKTQRRIIAHEQTLGALKLDLAAIARPPRRPPKELALRLEARAAALAMTVEHGRGERRQNALLELHELMSRIEVSPGSEPRETIVRLTPRHDALLALGLARGPVSKKYLDAARAARAAAAENASPDTPAPQTEPGSAP